MPSSLGGEAVQQQNITTQQFSSTAVRISNISLIYPSMNGFHQNPAQYSRTNLHNKYTQTLCKPQV